MRCRSALFLVVGCCALSPCASAAAPDPFEAFLAAKRELAAQANCPAPPPPVVQPTPIAEPETATPDVLAVTQAMANEASIPDPEVSVGRPMFRVLGVVGARGSLEAVVDPAETGRPRLRPGDVVHGWRVARVALSEIVLVHQDSEPAVLPVAGIPVRQR